MSKIVKAILGFGPGIFAIGYTIGTGSVTSMIVAESTFGTQLFNVFVLPLVVAGIIIVINSRKLMGAHSAGYLLNTMLGLAFLLSVIISYNGTPAVKAQLG
jgi:hypothetical protein